MDMLNKLKKKVLEDVEESESESSSSSSKALRSNGEAMSDDPVALQKEVTELKEHINKNYLIYVKRLEKRKERIRELEEYSKALLGDNERVNEKLKDYEGTLSEPSPIFYTTLTFLLISLFLPYSHELVAAIFS